MYVLFLQVIMLPLACMGLWPKFNITKIAGSHNLYTHEEIDHDNQTIGQGFIGL